MHPGGAKLLEQAAGNDATEEFYELHRKEVIERANYKKLRVGRLKDWNTQVERATEISRVPRRFSCLVYLGGCGARYVHSRCGLCVNIWRPPVPAPQPVSPQLSAPARPPPTSPNLPATRHSEIPHWLAGRRNGGGCREVDGSMWESARTDKNIHTQARPHRTRLSPYLAIPIRFYEYRTQSKS